MKKLNYYIVHYYKKLEIIIEEACGNTGFFLCVPGMALIQLETNQLQVVTAKYSEPQVENSNVGMEEVV